MIGHTEMAGISEIVIHKSLQEQYNYKTDCNGYYILPVFVFVNETGKN